MVLLNHLGVERAGLGGLVLAHTDDLIHPFNDARNPAEQLPRARLARAHSPLELRLRPERLTAELSDFLGDLWSPRKDATA